MTTIVLERAGIRPAPASSLVVLESVEGGWLLACVPCWRLERERASRAGAVADYDCACFVAPSRGGRCPRCTARALTRREAV